MVLEGRPVSEVEGYVEAGEALNQALGYLGAAARLYRETAEKVSATSPAGFTVPALGEDVEKLMRKVEKAIEENGELAGARMNPGYTRY